MILGRDIRRLVRKLDFNGGGDGGDGGVGTVGDSADSTVGGSTTGGSGGNVGEGERGGSLPGDTTPDTISGMAQGGGQGGYEDPAIAGKPGIFGGGILGGMSAADVVGAEGSNAIGFGETDAVESAIAAGVSPAASESLATGILGGSAGFDHSITSVGQTPGQVAGDEASSLGIGNIGAIANAADNAAAGTPEGIGRGNQDNLAMAIIDQDESLAFSIADNMSFSELADFNMSMNTANIDSIASFLISLAIPIPGLSPITAGALAGIIGAMLGIPAGLGTGLSDSIGNTKGGGLTTEQYLILEEQGFDKDTVDEFLDAVEESTTEEGTGILNTGPSTITNDVYSQFQNKVR